VSGRISVEKETLDLREVLQGVVEDSTSQLSEQGLDVTIALPDDPVWVQGDRVRLAQVFDNLLSNAIKFTDRPGRIRVEARIHAEAAVVEVQDNGVGIPPDLLPTIFEPFRQAEQPPGRS